MSAIQKRKLLENAQKFLQKGQLDRALKEFQTILQSDPRDTGTRLKIGDLHLRRGEKDEAIAAYLKVADQFMKDGFDAKAVALYKQTLKIDPARADVHVPLAELYQRLGLTSEAMTSLQSAADSLHREGRKRDALELLRKMATLDPSNTTSRLKIADLLQQAGMRDEALAELDEVAAELERQGDLEARARVHERVLELDHTRVDVVLALGRLALDQSRLQEAEAFARRADEARPDATGGLELLAEVLRAGARDDELEPVYRRLAEVHRVRGDEARAREILQRWVSSEPLLGDASESLPPVALGVAADDVEVLEETSPSLPPVAGAAPMEDAASPMLDTAPPVPAPFASDDADQLVAEANVYLRYQKVERAIASLEEALQRAPGHLAAVEKLAELLESRDPARATALRASAATAPPVASAELVSPIALPAPDDDAALDPGTEIDVEVDLDDALEGLESGAVPAAAEIDETTSHGLSAPDLAPFDDATEIEIELDESDETGLAPAAPGHDPADDTISSRVDATVFSTSLAVTAAQIVEEIEEAEFYFQQGLHDEAEAVYRRILASAPNHPQALLRLGEIAAARGEDPGASTGSTTPVLPDPDCELAPFDDAPGMDLAQSLDEVDLAASFSDLSLPDVSVTGTERVAAATPEHTPAAFGPGESASGPSALQSIASETQGSLSITAVHEVEARHDEPVLTLEAHEPLAAMGHASESNAFESDARALSATMPAIATVAPRAPETAASFDEGLAPLPQDGDAVFADAGALDAEDGGDAGADPLDSSLDDTATELDASGPGIALADGGERTLGPAPDEGDEARSEEEPADAAACDDAPVAPTPGLDAGEPSSRVDDGVAVAGARARDDDAAAVDDATDEFDLARELADAFEDDDATAGVEPPVASSIDDGIAAAFQEFKRGVSRIVDAADHQTHYDLGIAYREMGLLDDAAHELAIASASPALRLSALHLLALCAIDAKRPRDAVAHLTQVLSLAELPAEQEHAVRLDLARAQLAAGDVVAAREQIERVAAADATLPGLVELRAAIAQTPAPAAPAGGADAHEGEALERFDDLLGEGDPEPAPGSEGRAATTGAETPAPPASGPDTSAGGRRRRISFV